jgi:hypothetical protein
MSRLRVFLIGAVIAYFLDPKQGERRRRMLRDRAARLLRRVTRTGDKREERIAVT